MTVIVSTLENGLRVVTDTVSKVETAAIGVWVNAGTRHESAQTNGIAHMLEHMAFKGTKRRTSCEIAEEIEAVGGYLNAATSREATAYYARVLKDDVPLAFDILGDILQESVFDLAEIERERDVILQEIGQAYDTPDDIIFDYFQSTAYPDQSMGWPILGTVDVVRKLNRETITSYMNQHYTPSRMVLVAAGKVEHDDILKLAQDHFGGMSDRDVPNIEPASYIGGDFRQKRDLEQVHTLMGFEGLAVDHEDYYAVSMLANILGGGMSSRLFQEVREKRGLVYSIYAFKSSYSDSGLFGIYAGTGQEQMKELVPVICDEIAKVAESIQEEEICRTKAQLKASLMMGLESTTTRCEYLAQHMLHYGRPILPDELVQRIEAVDRQTIMRVAQEIFSSDMTFVTLGPIDQVDSFSIINDHITNNFVRASSPAIS